MRTKEEPEKKAIMVSKASNQRLERKKTYADLDAGVVLGEDNVGLSAVLHNDRLARCGGVFVRSSTGSRQRG